MLAVIAAENAPAPDPATSKSHVKSVIACFVLLVD
jgi:hypothetical protein